MRNLSDYVVSKYEIVKSKEWDSLRSACVEFEKKFNIHLWTVVSENCFDTPVKLMTEDLYELLIPKGLEVKKMVQELEKSA